MNARATRLAKRPRLHVSSLSRTLPTGRVRPRRLVPRASSGSDASGRPAGGRRYFFCAAFFRSATTFAHSASPPDSATSSFMPADEAVP
jgi:hypothetical protein